MLQIYEGPPSAHAILTAILTPNVITPGDGFMKKLPLPASAQWTKFYVMFHRGFTFEKGFKR